MRKRNARILVTLALVGAMCLTTFPESVYATGSVGTETSGTETVDETKDSSTDTTTDVPKQDTPSGDETTDQTGGSKGDNNQNHSDESTGTTNPDTASDSENQTTEPAIAVQETGDPETLVTPKVEIPDGFEEGTYYISASKSVRQVLDVSAGSKKDGGNVQLYGTNISSAQKWQITFDENGYATITNVGSGKVLDVSAGIAKNSRNVQQYSSNDSRAQKWVIKASASGYVISSALSEAYNPVAEEAKPVEPVESTGENVDQVSGQTDDAVTVTTDPTTEPTVDPVPVAKDFVLDCANGGTKNSTNIQIYTENGSQAQSFVFTKTNPETAQGSKTIEDGLYKINTGNTTGKCLDVAAGKTSNGANIQIYSANGSQAQAFQFTYEEATGCYYIANAASGLVLDVKDGNPIKGSNVQLWYKNGSNAQRWIISANEDGTYTLTNRMSGTVLDIAGGSTANGANIQTYDSNGSAAQKFTVEKVSALSDGVYSIFTTLNLSQTFDVPGASTGAGTQIQLYKGNASPAQKYVVHKVEDEDDIYTIAAVASGQFLTAESGKVVQRWSNGSDNQKWIITVGAYGLIVKNKETGTVMDCPGANWGNGTKIQMYAENNSKAQNFRFSSTAVVNNGLYIVSSAINTGRCLDVTGAKQSNGTNIQLYSSNGTNPQKFYFTSLGNNIYRINECRSGKALDVKNGSTADGANVQIWDSYGNNAQKWRVSITEDGWYTFTNVASGKNLDVSGGRNANGANIQSYTANGSASQRWHLTPTTKKIEDWVLAKGQAIANSKYSATNYLIAVDLTNHRVMVFQGSKGNWNNIKNWPCSNGAPSTPTVRGEYTIGSRGYSFGSGYTCYYYTQFYGNYLFHSVLYRQGTFNIKDGRLGMSISHGCIRMNINDAKWINQCIPSRTKVVTYN